MNIEININGVEYSVDYEVVHNILYDSVKKVGDSLFFYKKNGSCYSVNANRYKSCKIDYLIDSILK